MKEGKGKKIKSCTIKFVSFLQTFINNVDNLHFLNKTAQHLLFIILLFLVKLCLKFLFPRIICKYQLKFKKKKHVHTS